jgi:hypothetical protein
MNKIVPIEPTEEMRQAGWDRYKDVGDIWQAMLSAAPESDHIIVSRAELDALKAIKDSAINLVKVKGRHHSEIAMTQLIEAIDKARGKA